MKMSITPKKNCTEESELEIIMIQESGSKCYFPGKMTEVLGLVAEAQILGNTPMEHLAGKET